MIGKNYIKSSKNDHCWRYEKEIFYENIIWVMLENIKEDICDCMNDSVNFKLQKKLM